MRALFCLIALTFALNVLAQTVPCDVNQCTFAKAVTGNNTITFIDYEYDPPCLHVALGTVVTFAGDFAGHPLYSGSYAIPNVTPFEGSITTTKTGSSVSFTMNVAGPNPYYCDYHKERGMVGVIYVGDSCGSGGSPSATPVSAPTATAPTTPIAPSNSPVAPPTSKTPVKASSGVTVHIGALSMLAILAFCENIIKR